MPCIGQEGSDTVALVKAFIPDKWRAGSDTSPVCSATSMNFTAVCEEDARFEAVPEPMSQVGRALSPDSTCCWNTTLHTLHTTSGGADL